MIMHLDPLADPRAHRPGRLAWPGGHFVHAAPWRLLLARQWTLLS
jgi:hypothetical protein